METSKVTPTQKIFDAIKAQLDAGTVPWHKPWVVKSDGIVSHKGKSYSLRDLRAAVDIVIEKMAGKADSDVNIYDNHVFVELVVFVILKATKNEDSGIAGDHIIEGALTLAVAQALKNKHDEEKNSKEN